MVEFERWIAHLRDLAGRRVADAPIERPAVLEPLQAVLDGRAASMPAGITPDVALWYLRVDASVADGARTVETIACTLGEAGEQLDVTGPAPLLRPRSDQPLEVWTEAELSGLHALWGLGLSVVDPRVRRRAEAARDWHLEHTQPDNATNRPWALPVFLAGGTPEAVFYAETLLHNCLATNDRAGEPDPLSARVLLDAARLLERWVDGERAVGSSA